MEKLICDHRHGIRYKMNFKFVSCTRQSARAPHVATKTHDLVRARQLRLLAVVLAQDLAHRDKELLVRLVRVVAPRPDERLRPPFSIAHNRTKESTHVGHRAGGDAVLDGVGARLRVFAAAERDLRGERHR